MFHEECVSLSTFSSATNFVNKVIKLPRDCSMASWFHPALVHSGLGGSGSLSSGTRKSAERNLFRGCRPSGSLPPPLQPCQLLNSVQPPEL